MFWLTYECFSIMCDAFLLKSVISSHNSCALTYFIGNQPKKVKWGWSFGQNLGQIRSNVVNRQRNWCFNGFLSYFAWGIHVQARNSGYRNTWVETELATNTIFEEDQVKNCPFWFKNSKKWGYFRGFYFN